MPSLNLSTIGRRATIVAGSVAIASAVACSDEATAPRSVTTIPASGAQSTILPLRSLVTVKIKTIWGTLLPEPAHAMFVAGNDTGVVLDNTAVDKDPTVGVITVALPWSASFTACLWMDTPNYGIDSSKPYCNTVPGNAQTVDAGSLVMRQFPLAGIYLQDMYGNVVKGAKVSLDAVDDGFFLTAKDGGNHDLSVALDGKIVIKGNRPGAYTWCEIDPPGGGYMLTSPTCGTVNLNWDVSTGFIIKHQKKILIPFPMF